MASTMLLHALAEHGDQRDGEDEDREGLQDVGRAHDQPREQPAPKPRWPS